MLILILILIVAIILKYNHNRNNIFKTTNQKFLYLIDFNQDGKKNLYFIYSAIIILLIFQLLNLTENHYQILKIIMLIIAYKKISNTTNEMAIIKQIPESAKNFANILKVENNIFKVIAILAKSEPKHINSIYIKLNNAFRINDDVSIVIKKLQKGYTKFEIIYFLLIIQYTIVNSSNCIRLLEQTATITAENIDAKNKEQNLKAQIRFTAHLFIILSIGIFIYFKDNFFKLYNNPETNYLALIAISAQILIFILSWAVLK